MRRLGTYPQAGIEPVSPAFEAGSLSPGIY